MGRKLTKKELDERSVTKQQMVDVEPECLGITTKRDISKQKVLKHRKLTIEIPMKNKAPIIMISYHPGEGKPPIYPPLFVHTEKMSRKAWEKFVDKIIGKSLASK
jgi:hypothetical protein